MSSAPTIWIVCAPALSAPAAIRNVIVRASVWGLEHQSHTSLGRPRLVWAPPSPEAARSAAAPARSWPARPRRTEISAHDGRSLASRAPFLLAGIGRPRGSSRFERLDVVVAVVVDE